jgi:signal transduction histidine kinase
MLRERLRRFSKTDSGRVSIGDGRSRYAGYQRAQPVGITLVDRAKRIAGDYLFAIAITLGFFAAAWALYQSVRFYPGFFVLIPVIVVAWSRGFGAACAASAVAAMGMRLLFSDTWGLGTGELLSFLAYVVFGFLIARLSAARSKASLSLREANVSLESRVRERTAELEAHRAQLQERAEELKRSNEALERFAYVASHDLKEPLRMVVSFADLLKRNYGGRLDADADYFIDQMVGGALRMEELVTALLDLSQAGRELQPERVDMSEIVNEVRTTLAASLSEAGGVLTAGPLPVVMADNIQMRQLVQNLAANAIKYRGPEPPRIAINADQRGRYWVFSVRDNGIGIDRQYHDKIFLAFERLHGRQSYPGAGIGLAICKSIVERHNGSIWVESEEGRGSTFYFTLPAHATLPSESRLWELSHIQARGT